ncbi:hypothetical protein C2G38_2167363 [Gigaspora rosea]|uniref:Uncharacterized protein n=1 Tax=Gigaspora rosea TaxID=44941 RepID=A0A397W0P9_9GLOM|nr:hypothetical protein C2G38_2167363 [Gigaspora rosea]
MEHYQSCYPSKQTRQENGEGAQLVLQEVKHDVSTKDHVVAMWLGTNNANMICVIRQALDTFDWIEYKKASNKSLSKAEIEFTEILNKDKEKYAYLQDTKELLLLSECGTVDYGTHELKEQLSKNKRAKSLTEESTKAEIKRAKNNTKTPVVIAKETTQELAKEAKDKLAEVEVQMSIRTTNKELNNKQEGKIGALAAEVVYEENDMQGIQEAASSNKTETKQNSVQRKRRKKVFKEFLRSKNTKAVFLELWPKNTNRRELLQKSWGLHYENGKMTRMTHRRFDKETLLDRNKFKVITKNLPTSVVETVLLRQLKGIKAKVVYISSNNNGNQRATASIYFKSEEDLRRGTSEQVFYYNTKLELPGFKKGNNTRLGPDKQQSRFHERLSAQANNENQTQNSFSFSTKRRKCINLKETKHRKIAANPGDESTQQGT